MTANTRQATQQWLDTRQATRQWLAPQLNTMLAGHGYDGFFTQDDGRLNDCLIDVVIGMRVANGSTDMICSWVLQNYFGWYMPGAARDRTG